MPTSTRRTFDPVYLCVADERRRRVLEHLQDVEDGTAAFDQLVDHVVEQESDAETTDRESVIVDLYHVHLPKLADYGVIEYDDCPETVEYVSDPTVESLLEGMDYPGTETTAEPRSS